MILNSNESNWREWLPPFPLTQKLMLWSVGYSSKNILKISLREFEDSESVNIIFKEVYGFRLTDESDRWKFISTCKLAQQKNFLVSDDCEFLNWFLEEGDNVREKKKIKVFLVSSTTDILEVLFSGEPDFINPLKK